MTNREIVLDLLRKAGPAGVTTGELLAGGAGSRYGARIKELRERGFEIESTLERPGSWRYRLAAAEPEPICLFRDYTDPDGKWMRLPYSEVLAA
jgi:hypothetical protein